MFCKPVRNLGGAWARMVWGGAHWFRDQGPGVWNGSMVCLLAVGAAVGCYVGRVVCGCSSPVWPWVWVGAVGGHVGWWLGHIKPDTFTYNVEYY